MFGSDLKSQTFGFVGIPTEYLQDAATTQRQTVCQLPRYIACTYYNGFL